MDSRNWMPDEAGGFLSFDIHKLQLGNWTFLVDLPGCRPSRIALVFALRSHSGKELLVRRLVWGKIPQAELV